MYKYMLIRCDKGYLEKVLLRHTVVGPDLMWGGVRMSSGKAFELRAVE